MSAPAPAPEPAFQHLVHTDNRLGTDKTTLHAYGPLYATIFNQMKQTMGPRPKHLMEIGVLSGASVVNLAYIFPEATVYAVDIDLRPAIYRERAIAEQLRIQWYEIDATRVDSIPVELTTLLYDCIIDDGSHTPHDICAAFVLWAPRLQSGGYYVIEDLTEDTLRIIDPILKPLAKTYGIEWTLHDLRRPPNPRWDDIVYVGIKRGA